MLHFAGIREVKEDKGDKEDKDDRNKQDIKCVKSFVYTPLPCGGAGGWVFSSPRGGWEGVGPLFTHS